MGGLGGGFGGAGGDGGGGGSGEGGGGWQAANARKKIGIAAAMCRRRFAAARIAGRLHASEGCAMPRDDGRSPNHRNEENIWDPKEFARFGKFALVCPRHAMLAARALPTPSTLPSA